MKKTKLYISLLLAMFIGIVATAQVDSRQRTASTIIADGLAQLPAKTTNSYNKIIGEMAATGHDGLKMLCGMLKPVSEGGKNATFEYAIDGIVSYASTPGHENLKTDAANALVESIDACTDKPNRAFLMQQFAKVADKQHVSTLTRYLADADLREFAVSALASIPGIDDEAKDIVTNGTAAPKATLAKLAYLRRIAGTEDTLLSWLKGADFSTREAIYAALARVGTEKSVATLRGAIGNDANNTFLKSSAADCYLQLLDNIGNNTVVAREAKSLIAGDNQALRCAGLQLLLKSDQANATTNVVKALADADVQYRNTALDNALSTAGEGIFDAVAKQYNKLGTDAQTDVLRWMGNNHVSSQADLVANATTSADDVQAEAAIEAAGKIGGDKALQAIAAQLGGKHADAAQKALLSFNGDIKDCINTSLKSSSTTEQTRALQIASARHMTSAYPQVVALTRSTDETVGIEACKAIKGVSALSNFDEICSLMEGATGKRVEPLQQAAATVLATEPDANAQYALVNKHLCTTTKPQLYYPLLAQTGVDQAIGQLTNAYNDESTRSQALNALLSVNDARYAGTMVSLAAQAPESRDALVQRATSLIAKSSYTKAEKYLLYRDALATNPSDKVKGSIVSNLAQCKIQPAIIATAPYLDNEQTAMNAANTINAIMSANPAKHGGQEDNETLVKAIKVLQAAQQKGNADAGYACDQIAGYIPSMSPTGFTTITTSATLAKGKSLAIGNKAYENFELWLDFKPSADAEATITLRSTPLISIKGGNVSLGNAKESNANTMGEWNSIYIRMVDDRLAVTANGHTVVQNLTATTQAGKPLPATGVISLLSTQGSLELRSVLLNELKSTPVYTLSDEEKKAGFELLFDGRSLDKWQGNKDNYVPVDGNIYVSAQYGGTGNLYTVKKYRDFVYRFEFCFETPGVNNGIGVRTNIGTDAAYDGMEIQVLDHDDPIYAGLHAYQQHGSVYGIIVPKHVNFPPHGTWNTEEIRVVGDEVRVTVNGVVINEGNIRTACQGHNVAPDGSDNNPYTVDHRNHPGLFNTEGYISFCGHGAGVKFRNIRILDLSKNKSSKKTTAKKSKK